LDSVHHFHNPSKIVMGFHLLGDGVNGKLEICLLGINYSSQRSYSQWVQKFREPSHNIFKTRNFFLIQLTKMLDHFILVVSQFVEVEWMNLVWVV
jgi:hypothetical protein